MNKTPRVFGFAGWSGSGKTTLIEQVILRLKLLGHRVSLIKHAHHEFDIDHAGKDSFRHRQAGTAQVLISSANRWALMNERQPDEHELSLAEAIALLKPVDLVLVEGFKRAAIPKLEVHRPSLGKPLLHPQDQHIIAIASENNKLDNNTQLNAKSLTQFDLLDYDDITDFICQHVGLPQR
jgi:molybdopterin-guanine dinucleotide biosynthesis adapter protein